MPKLIIKSKVPFRTGTKDGKQWTLYHVTDSTGKKHSTFSDLPLDQEVELVITEKPYTAKDGTQKMGTTLSYPKRESGLNATLVKEFRDDIIALKQRMDFLEIRMNGKERVEKAAEEPGEPIPF